MHNTTGDVALTNIGRMYPKKNSSPFLSLGYVFNMFLHFEHFSASRSYKKVLVIK